MMRLPSASNFVPAACPLGERKMVACLVFGSNRQMFPAPGYLPEGSLHNGVNVISQKKTMPSSGLTKIPSVRKQAPSNTRSSLAPAGSTLGSPVGSGNPNSDIFSSTVCPEAMKSLLSELQFATSVVEWRQSQCQSSHTLRNG